MTHEYERLDVGIRNATPAETEAQRRGIVASANIRGERNCVPVDTVPDLIGPSCCSTLPMERVAGGMEKLKALNDRGHTEYSQANFYDNYRDYLTLSEVRRVHGEMFRHFMRVASTPFNVVDLGCATCEFGHRFFGPTGYTGIDLNLSSVPQPYRAIQGDYRVDAVQEQANLKYAEAFVSIFSTEIHLPYAERQAFYRSLFEKYPTIRAGMVSGFFYDGHETESVYTERLGFTVYQSVEPVTADEDLPYYELRCLRRVPPGMFGDPFTEVWKFLVRKGQ